MVVIWTRVASCGTKGNTAGVEIERRTLKVEASGKIGVRKGTLSFNIHKTKINQ